MEKEIIVVGWEVKSVVHFDYYEEFYDTIILSSQNECPVRKSLNLANPKSLLYFLEYEMCVNGFNDNDTQIHFVSSHKLSVGDTLLDIRKYSLMTEANGLIMFYYSKKLGVLMVNLSPEKAYFKKSIKRNQSFKDIGSLKDVLISNSVFYPPSPPPPPN